MHKLAFIFKYTLKNILEEYFNEYKYEKKYYTISDTISFAEYFFYGDYLYSDSRRLNIKEIYF